jgi:hypothetical protein
LKADDGTFDPGVVRAKLVQTPQKGRLDETDTRIVNDTECVLQLCYAESAVFEVCCDDAYLESPDYVQLVERRRILITVACVHLLHNCDLR